MESEGYYGQGRRDVLPSEANARNFKIYHRKEDGTPDGLYRWDDAMTTCVVKCINICRAMLKAPRTKDVFENLAHQYCRKWRSQAWVLNGVVTKENMKRVAETETTQFINNVCDRFPRVFVDHSIRNQDLLAVTWRRAWDGEFDTSKQSILLHGQRTEYMVAAAICSKQDKFQQDDYRRFLFLNATALLHELTHVYVTYLGKGQVDTPDTMRPRLVGNLRKTSSEAGRDMEVGLYGGTVDFWLDPVIKTPPGMCPSPYLFDGKASYRITEKFISATVDCNFKFPYKDDDEVEEIFPLSPLGQGMAEDSLTDPIDHPHWPKLLAKLPPGDY